MRFPLLAIALSLAVAALTGRADAQAKPPLVLAAASLQESMTAAAARWAAMGHPRPVISFASSSALARQIEAGAAADVFVSADEEWIDELARHNLIAANTRVSLLSNRLVLVTPAAGRVRVDFRDRRRLAAQLGAGPLAMADTASVPAGRYGRAALQSLGVWKSVMPRIVQAENVRAAMALVERGVAPFGIVYATDARASKGVRVAAIFPQGSHKPIRYPIARLKASTSRDAEGFRRFLISPVGRAIFARYGFGAG